MKTITGLEVVIRHWRGDPIKDQRWDGTCVDLTVKDALVNLAGTMRIGGKDQFLVEAMGQKLLSSDGSVELEDHPFELLSQAVATYANDAAAIRNDIYQLARSVKFLQDGMRAFGFLT